MSLVKHATFSVIAGSPTIHRPGDPLLRTAHRAAFAYEPRPGYLWNDHGMGGCAGPGCSRAAKCKGLCLSHDAQRRTGKPLTPLRARQAAADLPDRCLFDGCDRPHHARGWCQAHWKQWIRHGAVVAIQVAKTTCSFEGCGKPHSSHGLCDGHAIQLRSGRALTPLRVRDAQRGCSLEGCTGSYWARGMCQTHYNAWHWTDSDQGRAARVRAAAKRRATRASAEVKLVTDRDWARLVARHGGMCAYCQERPWEHREHVIPLSRGGREAIGNLLPACGSCNTSKRDRLLVEWRAAA